MTQGYLLRFTGLYVWRACVVLMVAGKGRRADDAVRGYVCEAFRVGRVSSLFSMMSWCAPRTATLCCAQVRDVVGGPHRPGHKACVHGLVRFVCGHHISSVFGLRCRSSAATQEEEGERQQPARMIVARLWWAVSLWGGGPRCAHGGTIVARTCQRQNGHNTTHVEAGRGAADEGAL